MENTMRDFFSKVFIWMFIGLACTFCTGSLVASNAKMLESIFSSGMMTIIVIAELALVLILGARLHKMSPSTAKILFIVYSILTGLTFSIFFVAYELSSIIAVFLLTAVIFLVLALIGFFTKIDISKIGTILFVSLIVLIILGIVNMFVLSEALDMGLCIFGLIIFMGYVCYDINKLKRIYLSSGYNENVAIYGALELYLDFINIFIKLLRLMGKSKD